MLHYKLVKSAILLGLLLSLTSCYTQFGLIAHESDVDAVEYEEVVPAEVTVHHVYIPPMYYADRFHYDPYNDWYFEPGLYFSMVYYYGPVAIHRRVFTCYPPYYYSPYYYPPYYDPYYYPPVHYYPVWHPRAYHEPRYVYTPRPLNRRTFARRSDQVLARNKTFKRRNSSSGSSAPLVRRSSKNITREPTYTNARRLTIKRKDNKIPATKRVYNRNEDRKRSSKTYSGSSSNDRRGTSTRSSNSYNSNRSKQRSSDSSYRSSSKSSNRSSTPKISRSGSTRSSGSRSSSSRSSVTRSSSSGSSRASVSRSGSSRSSRSSSSSSSSSKSSRSRK